MKNRVSTRSVWTFALWLVFFAGADVQSAKAANQTSDSSQASPAPAYNLAREIQVQGTIVKIENEGASGPLGTHILIQAAQGIVDVHLGFARSVRADSLGLSVGQSVSVTGMMQTTGDTSVLLARILTTANRIVILRNERGIPPRGARGQTASIGSDARGAL